MEANGIIFLEEKDAVTTVLASSAKFLRERRALAEKFVKAHAELTEWIKKNPEEAQKILREELKAETKREIPAELIARSWTRLRFTTEVSRPALEKFVENSKKIGFMRVAPDLSKLWEANQ
jgi:NitT/TauT family transport system substrate-binding protein